jgi:hypothetical protein
MAVVDKYPLPVLCGDPQSGASIRCRHVSIYLPYQNAVPEMDLRVLTDDLRGPAVDLRCCRRLSFLPQIYLIATNSPEMGGG